MDKDTGDPVAGANVEWATTSTDELAGRSPEEFLDQFAVDIGVTTDTGSLVVPVCGRWLATSPNSSRFIAEDGDLILLRLLSAERTDIVVIQTEQEVPFFDHFPDYLEIASATLNVETTPRRTCAGHDDTWVTAQDVADDCNR